MPKQSKKLSFNFSILGHPAVVIPTIAISVVSAMGVPIFYADRRAQRNASIGDVMLDHRTTEYDRTNFTLNDPHQVSSQSGAIRYDLDFKTQIITIDSSDQADLVMRFDEFQNPDFIRSAFEAAQQVAQRIVSNHNDPEAFEETWIRDRDLYEDMIADAQTFIAEYNHQQAATFVTAQNTAASAQPTPPRP